MQPVYEQAVQAGGGLGNVTAVALQDDVVFVGKPEAVNASFARPRDLLPSCGLTLSLPKCRLLACGPAMHVINTAVQSIVAAHQLSLHFDCFELWGGYVGYDRRCNDGQASDWALSKMQECSRAFALLQSQHLRKQAAYLLLRVGIIPCAVFLARVLPPGLSSSALLWFDEQVQSVLRWLLQWPLSAPVPLQAFDQSSLPLRMGGLGLRRMAPLADIAYLSSVAAALPRIRLLMEGPALVHAPPYMCQIELRSAYVSFHQDGLPEAAALAQLEALPASAEEFFALHVGGSSVLLQKALTALKETRDLDSFLSLESPSLATFANGQAAAVQSARVLAVQERRARLQSQAAPHASLWLCVLPILG
jgi:hypothetical protein